MPHFSEPMGISLYSGHPHPHLPCYLGGTPPSVEISTTSNGCYGNHRLGGSGLPLLKDGPQGMILGKLLVSRSVMDEEGLCVRAHSFWDIPWPPGQGPLDSWCLGFIYSLRILQFPDTISGPHLAYASRICSTLFWVGGVGLVLSLWGQSLWTSSSQSVGHDPFGDHTAIFYISTIYITIHNHNS